MALPFDNQVSIQGGNLSRKTGQVVTRLAQLGGGMRGRPFAHHRHNLQGCPSNHGIRHQRQVRRTLDIETRLLNKGAQIIRQLGHEVRFTLPQPVKVGRI